MPFFLIIITMAVGVLVIAVLVVSAAMRQIAHLLDDDLAGVDQAVGGSAPKARYRGHRRGSRR